VRTQGGWLGTTSAPPEFGWSVRVNSTFAIHVCLVLTVQSLTHLYSLPRVVTDIYFTCTPRADKDLESPHGQAGVLKSICLRSKERWRRSGSRLSTCSRRPRPSATLISPPLPARGRSWLSGISPHLIRLAQPGVAPLLPRTSISSRMQLRVVGKALRPKVAWLWLRWINNTDLNPPLVLHPRIIPPLQYIDLELWQRSNQLHKVPSLFTLMS
jgi:hypothetical protein